MIKHLKVRTKLMAGFMIVTALCVIMGAAGIIGMKKTTSSSDAIYHSIMALPDLNKSLEYAERMRIQLRNIILADGDTAEISLAAQKLSEYEKLFLSHTSDYRETIKNAAALELFDNAVSVFNGGFKLGAYKIIAGAKSGEPTETLKEILNSTSPAADEIVRDLTACTDLKLYRINELDEENHALQANVTAVILAVLLAVIVISLLISLYTSGLISKPLNSMSAFMKKASSTGDISLTAGETGVIDRYKNVRDEIGEVIGNFAVFIRRVNGISDKLERIARGDLTVNVDVLSEQDTIGLTLQKMVNGLSGLIGDLNRKNELTEAFNRAAVTFISGAGFSFEETMTKGVWHIADAAQIDRVTLWRSVKRSDGDHGKQIYRWDRESGGTTKSREDLEDIHYSKTASFWLNPSPDNEPLNGPVDGLPNGELLKSFGVVSAFLQPVHINGSIWGGVLFENRKNELRFDDDTAEMLRSAAFLCVNAIIREEMKNELIEAEVFKTTRRAEKSIQLLFDSMPMCGWYWKDPVTISNCNEETVKLLNLPDKASMNYDCFRKLSPEYQPNGKKSTEAAREKLDEAFNSGYCRFEWLHRTYDGQPLPCEVTLIRSEYSGETVVLCYVRDMREQKRMLAEINKENELNKNLTHWYKSIINAIPFMVTVQNERAEWTFVNAAFEKRAGKSCESVKGVPCKEWGISICGTERCAIACAKRGLAQTRFYDSGQKYLVNVNSLTDIHGNPAGYVEVIQDITEIERMAKEKAEAESANRAKTAFLSNMSHEMRTPMNAIINMAVIGKSAEGAERKDDAFDKIEEASAHLLGVINDVLDMSKIEAGMLELSPVEFDFERMLRGAVNVVSFPVNGKRQKLSVNVDGKTPRFIVGDDKRFAQVIMNLLSNAVKFTPDGGEIGLGVSAADADGGYCELLIEVTDTGIGISEEQREKLFKAFSQADSGINRKYGGTGLGLVISKRIVEMMGGALSVESEPKKGSRFFFTVKVKKAKEPERSRETAGKTAPEEAGEFAGKRLLLVEDIEINREIVIALLEDTGLIIDSAGDGRTAVEMVEAAPDKYDLIFMDIQMPQMDGLTATRRIRALPFERCKNLPVVAMTADVFKDDIEKCLEAGMNDHIGKPLNLNEIHEKLRRYLSEDRDAVGVIS